MTDGGLLSTLLTPLGWAWGGVGAARRALYRRGWRSTHLLPGPVISVGNLSVGGSGKTPLVYWIARRLADRGHRVAILARGYGLQVGGEQDDERVPPEIAQLSVQRFNDADRVRSGEMAFKEWQATCALLDDGFQHLRVARNLDIVCVDASVALGRTLPAGRLRELPNALRHASHIAMTRVDQATDIGHRRRVLASHAPGVPISETRMRPVSVQRGPELTSCEALAGQRVLAFSGIGNPAAFERTVAQMGLQVAEAVRFRDHHPYSAAELADLERRRERAGASLLVTTRKDLFRMSSPPPGIAALVVEIEFVSGEEDLCRAIDRAVPPRAPSR